MQSPRAPLDSLKEWGKASLGKGFPPKYYVLTHVGARAVTKPVVGVFDLASNVSEGALAFSLHNNRILICRRYTEYNNSI